MRRFYLVAILLASVGCERIEPDQTQSPLRPTEETPALMKVHARVDETRTSLGGPRGTEVRWSAGDAIALWGEDSPACRRYAIDDRFAGGTSADFTGEAFESAVYYACYPYRPDAVAEGAGVTTTLPAVQPFGGSGTFAAGISPMTARSTRADDLRFTSVCGVVRLQLTGTATIRSIRLTALDGAPLAGRMRFEWTAAGGWTIRSVDAGHPSILLDCGAGGAALSGGDPVVFCLVVPPGSYRGWRFTITDTEGGQMVRETSQAEVVLAANHIKTYNPIAYAATEPAPVALEASATANCYVVARAGRYEFDATTMGNGAVTPPDAAYTAGSTCGKADGIVPEALRPVTAKLLWQTAPNLIGEVSLGEEGRIRFTTADPFVEGNAVVAACDADGAILWSWHLWLTSADLEGSLHRYALPYEGLGAAAVMDRNLGALAAAWLGADNASSYGMFYQWGRKDPFVPFRSSQERMAVVVEAKDVAEFMGYCREENIEAVEVADVTDTARMRMFNKGRKVVDLAREFIDSAGAKHYAEAMIGEVENRDPFAREVEGATFAERFEENLRDNNVVSQRGLIEMFDSTIGRSTVLMPFGGRTQGSETQVSVQKLPTDGYTDTASIMAFGYNPYLASWSPYHAAAYAVVEAAAKVVAAGARYDRMRYSYQEYFERMTRDPRSWGKPLGALLGALKMQVELGLPSIGGKDSMSGTFQHINVPPMLMAFGITTVNAGTVISTDFKKAGNRIYLVRHTPRENHMPDTAQLKDNFGFVSENIERGNILAAWSVGFGGVAEGLAKMAFGNRIGAEVEMDEAELFGYAYGSILVESAVELTHPAAGLLGMTAADGALTVNGVKMPLDALYKANTEKFAAVYPDKGENHAGVMTSEPAPRTFAYRGEAVEHPLVYIPVFPGTNCDYDTAKAFRKAGAEVEMSVLCNLGGDDILRSIREMKEHIRRAHIFVLSGGFSSGDEPDGSAKFIVNVLNNKDIRDEIHALLDRGGLILGICNGFQALVKSGLLPYGRLGMVTKDSPTLFRNDINRHISQIVSTRVSTLNSPWLAGFGLGDIHSIAVSHGEGKFVVSEELARELFANGQVAFQYVDPEGRATAEAPYNPNGSSYAIEGLVSRDGQILGKMGHTERYEKNLFKNIAGEKEQSLFRNAVDYFRKN